MKLLLSTIILCTLVFPVLAQDVIFTSDGKKVEAKILEVGTQDIKYKKSSNMDGPTYLISKTDVLIITYENGSHETFAAQQVRRGNRGRVKPYDSLTTKYGKNFITYNTIGLLNTNLTFAYERIMAEGHLGLRIPITIGFAVEPDNYYYSSIGRSTVFASGLDINFYPDGQGKIRYFVGASFLMTSFYYKDYYGSTPSEILTGTQTAAMMKHGLVIQVTPAFNMSFVLGLGVRQNQTVGYYDYGVDVKGVFEFNVGYRF